MPKSGRYYAHKLLTKHLTIKIKKGAGSGIILLTEPTSTAGLPANVLFTAKSFRQGR
jgi:hypothetical protein